ncbi:hypothetical protein ILUMI_27172 [Ignelater luminosus]|uniref:Transposase n=1 Tax=Ignelater luminosus TaxID=2038154 RepID=A0A8K0C3A3_IGNLU|nr:hypothetical protein ILUMI_27172 [Ignelater luminosus]
MELSEEDRIEILIMIGFGDRKISYQAACNFFNQHHPETESPVTRSTAYKTYVRWFERRTVKSSENRGRPKSVTTFDKSLAVIQNIIEEPHSSTNRLSLNHDISASSVRKILKKENATPYKLQLHQELDVEDRLCGIQR